MVQLGGHLELSMGHTVPTAVSSHAQTKMAHYRADGSASLPNGQPL